MSSPDAGEGAQAASRTYHLVYRRMRVGPCLVFPCDEAGTVELNGLTGRTRDNYLLARALVGRDFYPPSVVNVPSGTVALESGP